MRELILSHQNVSIPWQPCFLLIFLNDWFLSDPWKCSFHLGSRWGCDHEFRLSLPARSEPAIIWILFVYYSRMSPSVRTWWGTQGLISTTKSLEQQLVGKSGLNRYTNQSSAIPRCVHSNSGVILTVITDKVENVLLTWPAFMYSVIVSWTIRIFNVLDASLVTMVCTYSIVSSICHCVKANRY